MRFATVVPRAGRETRRTRNRSGHSKRERRQAGFFFALCDCRSSSRPQSAAHAQLAGAPQACRLRKEIKTDRPRYRDWVVSCKKRYRNRSVATPFSSPAPPLSPSGLLRTWSSHPTRTAVGLSHVPCVSGRAVVASAPARSSAPDLALREADARMMRSVQGGGDKFTENFETWLPAVISW